MPGIRPAPESGLVDAEKLAGLTERYPAGGEGFWVVSISAYQGENLTKCYTKAGAEKDSDQDFMSEAVAMSTGKQS